MELPFEILTLVFTFLPQKDLDNVQLVCKAWKEIASDKVWREQFFDHYGTDRVCPVSPYFSLWRRELIARNEILHRWKKCSKQTDITINSTLTDNTEIFCSFGTDVARAICFNSHRGAGNIIELDRGKIKRRLYASRYSRETLPVATVDGSRFGMIYGFLDGSVTTVAFSRDGTVASEYTDLPYKHDSAVSSVWIAKSRNFNKPANRAVGIATGSFNGAVILNNALGRNLIHPERSPVCMLEGSMYGSYAADDGDVIVAYYRSGSVYRFICTEESVQVKKLTTLPQSVVNQDLVAQLHLCNNYAIIQTPQNLFVVDIQTCVTTEMDLPEGTEITAFSIDKSHTPGTKYMAAGLSTNYVCAWALPPLESTDTASGEAPKIELVKSRSSPAPSTEHLFNPNESFGLDTSSRLHNILSEDRQIHSKTAWFKENPIGYEHRLTQSGKPQITNVALNSAILLIGGYNGMVMAVDVLTGRTLKKVNSRISKNVLDLTRYSRDGLVPVTHLEIDPDPTRLRSLISVRPAVQFFDLGRVGGPKQKYSDRKRGSKSKSRGVNLSSSASRYDLEEAIELRDNFAIMDQEQEERDASLFEDFGMEGMEDEEQIAYAMMLSQQQDQRDANPVSEDEELRLALQLSTLEESQNDGSDIYEPAEAFPHGEEEGGAEGEPEVEDEDENLRRAIELSLQSS